MKKLLFGLSLITSLFMAGCLKDEGFENGQYGTQIEERPGVAFPQASASPLSQSITGQAAPLMVAGPIITLEQSGAASSDVRVQLAIDQALVTNTAGLTPLPAGSFTVTPMEVIIPAGQKRFDSVKIIINNSNTLDPSKKYGVGIRITSVTSGYQIAANQSTVVVSFTIKNKYDGVYNLRGFHNRPGFQFPYQTVIHMITQGPNTVKFYWPEVKSDGHPIATGPNNNLSWYGIAISPVVEFDLNTDLVTNVFNNPPQSTPLSIYTGAGSGTGRFVVNPTTGAKTMYVYFRYNANDARAFMDTLTFTGPRP